MLEGNAVSLDSTLLFEQINRKNEAMQFLHPTLEFEPVIVGFGFLCRMIRNKNLIGLHLSLYKPSFKSDGESSLQKALTSSNQCYLANMTAGTMESSRSHMQLTRFRKDSLGFFLG